jgi:hypothetical protein
MEVVMPDRRTDIEDALNPRLAGSTEGMTLQVLAQIRDSLSAMSRDIRTNNEATSDVRERVIRLEERDKRLETVETDLISVKDRLALLETDKSERDGARGAFAMIKDWAPFMAMVFSMAAAAWLYGRSLGITPAPPVPVPTQINRDQHIDGEAKR